MSIGYLAFVKNLQENVHYIGVSLFYLVKENYGIGLSAYLFGELACLIVSYISGRRADDSRNAVLFHKLGHIKPYKRIDRIEKLVCKHLYKLGLADTGRSYENE